MSFAMNLLEVLCHSLFVCLSIISDVKGCAVTPQGQERTVNFVITGYTLPVGFTWTPTANVAAQLSNILGSEAAVRASIQNLVMHAVFDALEEQGRRAGIGGVILSAILQQVTVQTTYTPMRCFDAGVNPAIGARIMFNMANLQSCIIFGNTVTGVCTMANCQLNMPNNFGPVPPQHLTIGATIRTSNFILATWSTQMWQSILNRAAAILRSGPFAENFASLSATIF